ncbi:MAG: ATP-dependent Clp protease adaptor ClpS [Lachnospiraceae bacterium]|nr:ATP-dependent Clp protease adaptor ClpS [Lachnospiraceae bacterium]
MAGKTKKSSERGVRVKYKLKEPSFYKVIMLNDDVTPMDFVVMLLVEHFGYEHGAAVDTMLKVHNEGKAVIARYPYDIAVTKKRKCIELARKAGYPFDLKVEAE